MYQIMRYHRFMRFQSAVKRFNRTLNIERKCRTSPGGDVDFNSTSVTFADVPQFSEILKWDPLPS